MCIRDSCDGDTPAGCSNKRISHSVAKSIEFLDSCIEKASINPTLESTPIIAAVEVDSSHDILFM